MVACEWFYSVSVSLSGYSKKVVLLLAASALGWGVLTAQPAQSASDGPKSEETASNTSQSGPVDKPGTGDSFFTQDTDLTGGSGFAGGSGELFFRAMLAVLFVIVLGAGAIYVSRRLLPRIINVPGKKIRIVETAHLGPKKAVHVIEVGNRRLLVGSTAENITTLADITDDLIDLSTTGEGHS